ncbi:hypothetical protein AAHH78_42385, partial [Burkholderia pseudomallei]
FIKCTFNDITEVAENGLMQGGVVSGTDHVTAVLAQHEHIQIDAHNYVVTEVIAQMDGSEADKH